MKIIQDEFSTILEIKKSKFIAYICPYCNFNTMLSRLKKEHSKARHFVYAYQYLNEFDQIVQNSSDDGEPKSTSGKPSLKVLEGANLINTAVVIVRYFGGIKLGTGGLVKAYSDAVNKVITQVVLFPYEKLETKIINLKYANFGKIEYLLDYNDIKIQNKDFTNDVRLILVATKEKFDILKEILPLGITLKNA